MSEEFLKSIKLISVDLTRQEKKIARVVLSDPEKVQTMTILELAKKAKVGTATISRFAKHVGCVILPTLNPTWRLQTLSRPKGCPKVQFWMRLSPTTNKV